MLQLTHGIVTVNNSRPAVAADVQTLTFPTFTQSPVAPTPPATTTGVLIIKNVPSQRNFVVNDVIVYTDGNNNNTKFLRVTSVDGPCKYKIVVQ